jgi:3-(methylthio)propionyl---CoA ligase
MKGLMQDWPLTVPKILDHAALHHGTREVVTRLVEGPIHRSTYDEIHSRTRKLAQALARLGVGAGDRVGTLAWNTQRHLESWYAIAGIGAIYHTVNPRLFAEQIVYIVNHAEDRCLLVDLTFVPLLEGLKDKLPTVETYVILTDRAHMPRTGLPGAVAYEDLIAAESGDFDWARVDENDAVGLCYTSGTTGNPKGVLYSHRSTVLHTLMTASADVMGLRGQDCILPVVPMFHANAWGIAFSAPMLGAKLVMPGAKLDPVSLYELLEGEKVSCSGAVPTVWLGLLAYLKEKDLKLGALKRLLIGGSAAAPVMIETLERDFGVEVCHAWGMTEMSPLGSTGSLKAGMDELPFEQKMAIKAKQGHAFFGVEMRIVDEAGLPLPWDGKACGHLQVRGPAVAARYFKDEGPSILDAEGWFATGDIATIDPDGIMQITDRSKDVIKSGGEWISSIEIESIAAGHPAVAEAAVIGIRHPKWDERPLLLAVLKPGFSLDKAGMLAYLEGRIAKWWMPEDVVFLPELPHTATGKIQKVALREQFASFALPPAAVSR